MTGNTKHRLFVALIVSLVVIGLQASAFGQGRGGGHGGGPPSGGGGMGRSSDTSGGRDMGRGNASDRSNGRSDTGMDRGRTANDNLKDADNDLRHHPGIANSLHVNANALRAAFQAALAKNPNLTFGQFVAATRLAHNLGGRHPNITRDAILAGLAAGKSIGQTLQDLGLGKGEAKESVKEAERENKQSRKD